MGDTLWLPEEVTVTLDWNGKVLRNTHEYSDFKIFNVDASEKIGTRRPPQPLPKEPRIPPFRGMVGERNGCHFAVWYYEPGPR